MKVEGQCFSCYDYCMFQYHGMDYNSKTGAVEYVQNYIKNNEPVIDCVTCGDRKRYVKEKGKWKEEVVNG